jgi:hypothetical protein
LDHISSIFGSHVNHVSSTFGSRFRKEHAVLPSFKIHVPITIKRSTNRSNRKQLWSMFESHFKHVFTKNILCHQVSKYMCRSHFKHFWSMFASHFKHVWITCFINGIIGWLNVWFYISNVLILLLLQKYFECDPDVLQMCSRDASLMFQMCFRCAPEMLH